MDDINNKLKEIRNEDIIWIIYLGIIALSFYSNYLEKDYLINKNIPSKDKYQKIMIFIFAVLLIVYLYFLKDSLDSFNDLKETDSDEKKTLVTLALVASALIFISGAIFLYVAIKNDNLDVELAFN